MFESLFLSAVMLIVANVAVAKSRYAAGWVAATGIICSFMPCMIFDIFLAVILQALLLCGLLFVLFIPRHGRRVYLIASCFATLGT